MRSMSSHRLWVTLSLVGKATCLLGRTYSYNPTHQHESKRQRLMRPACAYAKLAKLAKLSASALSPMRSGQSPLRHVLH